MSIGPKTFLEVVSPATEADDRDIKFDTYHSIGSLQDYLLVTTDRLHADLFTRAEEFWGLTSAGRLEDSIELPSIGCHLALSEIYEKVEFFERQPYMRLLCQ